MNAAIESDSFARLSVSHDDVDRLDGILPIKTTTTKTRPTTTEGASPDILRNWLVLITDVMLPIYSVTFCLKSPSLIDPPILAMFIIAIINLTVVVGVMCIVIPITLNSDRGCRAFANFYDQIADKYHISTGLRYFCGFPNLGIQALSFIGPTDGADLVHDSRWWLFIMKLLQFSILNIIQMRGKNHGRFLIAWTSLAQWTFIVEMMSASYLYVICNPGLYGSMMVTSADAYTFPTTIFPYQAFPTDYAVVDPVTPLNCQPHQSGCYPVILDITSMQTGNSQQQGSPIVSRFTPGCWANNRGSTTFRVWSRDPLLSLVATTADVNRWNHQASWYVSASSASSGFDPYVSMVFESYYGTKLDHCFWFAATLVILQVGSVTLSLWADIEKKLTQTQNNNNASDIHRIFATDMHGFAYWLLPTCGLAIIYWIAFLRVGALDYSVGTSQNTFPDWNYFTIPFAGYTKLSNCYDDAYWNRLFGLVAVTNSLPLAALCTIAMSYGCMAVGHGCRLTGDACQAICKAFSETRASDFSRVVDSPLHTHNSA